MQMTITKEECYFIKLLSDYINQIDSQKQEVNFNEVFTLAKNHQVDGIVYDRIKPFSDEIPLCDEIKKLYNASYFIYTKRKALLSSVRQALTKANITFVCFKGLELAKYYPNPFLRIMGDSDILLHMEDIEKAIPIMSALGFDCKSSNNEWQFRKNGFLIEFHPSLVYSTCVYKNETKTLLESVWENLIQENDEYHFTPEFNMFYLLVHLYKHFLQNGVGFRQFMDIALISQNSEINWKNVRGLLEFSQIMTFSQNVFACIYKWFGIKIPILEKEIDEDFFVQSTKKILSNGVFGFHDKSNEQNGNLALLKEKYNSKREIRKHSTMQRLFPSYKQLCNVQHYSFIIGKPYLLPITWIYRFFYSATHKNIKSTLESVSNSINVSDRLDFIDKWGL